MHQIESSDLGPDNKPKFQIAIIGSGPIGKLLVSFTKPHPRITYSQFEADKLPLRPSFGYGVGPQTLRAAEVIDEELGRQLREKCFLGPVWMNFYHGGNEDRLIQPVTVPESEGGLYGRLGRQELMDLLDSFVPAGHETLYDTKLETIVKPDGDDADDGLLELKFEDGSRTKANAVWGCDGMNSLCRRLLQGEAYEGLKYSGMLAFRGRVRAELVEKEVGRNFDKDTFMCLGVNGWCILVFPIDSGEFTNIAAFSVEPVHTKKGRDHVVALEEILSYFPGRNDRIDRLLRLLSETPGGPQRLELTNIGTLPAFSSPALPLTTFGDAANGMLPFIAGSMSTGFIGAATFLREFNSRIDALAPDASDEEISKALADASAAYDQKHRPLAQKLHDYSVEQGPLWSSATVDVDELSRRPKFLWKAADHLRS